MGKRSTRKGGPNLRVGFDLGGTKMMASVLDKKGRVLASERISSRGYEGMKRGISRMVKVTRRALIAAGATPDRVEAIGIACPAVVDLDKGIMVEAPNLGWRNAPIAKVFGEEFPGIPIAVMNDVDAGTFGEYTYGAGRGARTVLGIFPGTGLGGGCVYDGKLLRGKRFSCMEIGNLRLPGPALFGSPDTPPRIEDIVSRLGLAGAAAISAYRGNSPTILDNCGTDIRQIKSDALATAAKAGDPAVLQAIDNCIFYLSIAVAGAVDLLGPDRIVLGGGLVEKMPEAFADGLKTHLKKLASPGLVDDLKIATASLGDDAAVAGAAAYAATQI